MLQIIHWSEPIFCLHPFWMYYELRVFKLMVSRTSNPLTPKGYSEAPLLHAAFSFLSFRSKVIVERARLRQLAWGDSSHISKLQREFPDGFDFIVGADIVYAMEHVSSLFQTAHSLLKTSTEVGWTCSPPFSKQGLLNTSKQWFDLIQCCCVGSLFFMICFSEPCVLLAPSFLVNLVLAIQSVAHVELIIIFIVLGSSAAVPPYSGR